MVAEYVAVGGTADSNMVQSGRERPVRLVCGRKGVRLKGWDIWNGSREETWKANEKEGDREEEWNG